jgi:hypothetical protein
MVWQTQYKNLFNNELITYLSDLTVDELPSYGDVLHTTVYMS